MPEPHASASLRLWQRFHVRLSLMYGGLVLAVLVSISAFFYVRGVGAERAALQARLRIAATSLAASITPEDVAAIRTPADVDGAAYRALAERFRAVAAAEREFSDIYVMRRGPDPDALVFVVDVVVRGDAPPGLPGEAYVPRPGTRMAQGFAGPTVEDEPYTDAWGTVLSGYAPIRDRRGVAIAIVGVDVRASRLAAIKREVLMLALGVLAIAMVVLAGLAVVVGRSVREPLAQIVAATNAIAAGRFQVRAQVHRSDEFGVVGKHFDEMAHGLEERDFIKATFGQYVSPAVVNQMIVDRSEAVRGQRRHVAVMFVDVRRFTTLSEGLPPEEVVLLLNAYLDRMTQEITRHDGRIDKFIGDAIMADWGTRDGADAPETRAIAAAFAMIRALDEFNAERAGRGAFPLEFGIAIHAGEVVVGSIGSAHKLEYTVIGDAVNVASRLEGLCKVFSARLVVSGTLVAAAGAGAHARWLDTLVLRGRAEPTDVYELLTPDDPRVAQLDAYAAAIVDLRAGRVAAARTALEALAPDPVIAYHLARLA